MTSAPDRYQDLASLPFAGGYPTDETARTLEDELFFQRAVQVYGPEQAFFDRRYKPGDFIKTAGNHGNA